MTFYNCQTAVIPASLIVFGPTEKQQERRLGVSDTLHCVMDRLEPEMLPDELQSQEKGQSTVK